MNSKKKGGLRFGLIVSFIAICILIAFILSLDGLRIYCLQSVKDILDWRPLYYIIIAFSFLIGLYYSLFYVIKGVPKELPLVKIFGPFIDPLVNSLGYGLAIRSILSLFRGLFNQLFFSETYFTKLDFIDIATLMLACVPLLIWSVGGLVNYFVIVFQKDDSETGYVEKIENDE